MDSPSPLQKFTICRSETFQDNSLKGAEIHPAGSECAAL